MPTVTKCKFWYQLEFCQNQNLKPLSTCLWEPATDQRYVCFFLHLPEQCQDHRRGGPPWACSAWAYHNSGFLFKYVTATLFLLVQPDIKEKSKIYHIFIIVYISIIYT